MDLNLVMFTIGFSAFLMMLVIAEQVWKANKRKKRNKIAVKRMNTFIQQAKNEKFIKQELDRRENMIEHYLKYRLEYDPSTCTYVKVERVPSNEIAHYKSK